MDDARARACGTGTMKLWHWDVFVTTQPGPFLRLMRVTFDRPQDESATEGAELNAAIRQMLGRIRSMMEPILERPFQAVSSSSTLHCQKLQLVPAHQFREALAKHKRLQAIIDVFAGLEQVGVFYRAAFVVEIVAKDTDERAWTFSFCHARLQAHGLVI